MVHHSTLKEHLCLWYSTNRKAKEIAEHLVKSDFEGSRGWLDKWKKKYNVKRLKVIGESADVRRETVDSWKESLPEIAKSYAKEDTLSMDETGVFWQALPYHGFGQKTKHLWRQEELEMCNCDFLCFCGGRCEGETNSHMEIQTPRRPRKFNKSALPVDYFGEKKAWMTREIASAVLTKLNRCLSSCN